MPISMASRTSATPSAGSLTTSAASGARKHDGQRDLAQPRPLAVVAQPAEHQRADQHQAELGELGRLDLEAAGQVDPRVRAVHHAAQRGEHGQQAEQGGAVDHRRPGPDPPDVQRAHRHHQAEPDAEPEHVLVQVGARVARRAAAGPGSVADQTSSVPSTHSASTTAISIQSRWRRKDCLPNARVASDRRGSGSAAARPPVPPGSRCEPVALPQAHRLAPGAAAEPAGGLDRAGRWRSWAARPAPARPAWRPCALPARRWRPRSCGPRARTLSHRTQRAGS